MLRLMAPFLLSVKYIHTIVLVLFPIISTYGSVQQCVPFAMKAYAWFNYWPGYTTKLIQICKSRIRAHEKQMKKKLTSHLVLCYNTDVRLLQLFTCGLKEQRDSVYYCCNDTYVAYILLLKYCITWNVVSSAFDSGCEHCRDDFWIPCIFRVHKYELCNFLGRVCKQMNIDRIEFILVQKKKGTKAIQPHGIISYSFWWFIEVYFMNLTQLLTDTALQHRI